MKKSIFSAAALLVCLCSASFSARVVTKFYVEDTGIIVDATGSDLTEALIQIQEPDGNVIRIPRTYDPPQDSITWNYEGFRPTQVGDHFVKIFVTDQAGVTADADGTIIVENRSPDINIDEPSLSNPGIAVMGESVTFKITADDPDKNLATVELLVKVPNGSFLVHETFSGFDPMTPFSGTSDYTFVYTGPDSLNSYEFKARATDTEGLEVESNIVILTPSNPSESVEVKAQLRADPDKSIWFNDSPVAHETFELKKYED